MLPSSSALLCLSANPDIFRVPPWPFCLFFTLYEQHGWMKSIVCSNPNIYWRLQYNSTSISTVSFLHMLPCFLTPPPLWNTKKMELLGVWAPRSRCFNSYYMFWKFLISKRKSKSCCFVWLCKLEHFMCKKSRFSFRNNHFASLLDSTRSTDHNIQAPPIFLPPPPTARVMLQERFRIPPRPS